MKSMTGYACCESSALENDTTHISISVELKGYNSRFLDLQVNVPSWLSSLDLPIRQYLSLRFNRGKIEAVVRIKEPEADIKVFINKTAASAYYKALSDLAAELELKEEKLSLNQILSLDGVIQTEINRDQEKYKEPVLKVLSKASDQFESFRAREGKNTEEDILKNLSVIEKSLELINFHAPKAEKTIKENLRIRFKEFFSDRIDENRILAETAVLLVKYTISEELSRLSSHLKEFRLEAEKNPSPGKKLDFICQEINREINTIGSKNTILEVSGAVVEIKNALENIREQLRNVE